MAKQINEIVISKIETKNEEKWFSLIKQLVSNAGFGTLELKVTIKNSQVSNIADIKMVANHNIDL